MNGSKLIFALCTASVIIAACQGETETECVNWFGNNLDWNRIPYTQYGNTPWGYTPNGCIRSDVEKYGKFFCGVKTGTRIATCNGTGCQDGVCTEHGNEWHSKRKRSAEIEQDDCKDQLPAGYDDAHPGCGTCKEMADDGKYCDKDWSAFIKICRIDKAFFSRKIKDSCKKSCHNCA